MKANINMALTLRSNLISVLVLEGRQLRASARSISLPGQYVMTRSYCCRKRSILWSHARGHCEIFQADHLEGLVVCFHDECPSIQVCIEFFTTIYDGQEFSLNVGVAGLGVHEGFAGKSNGLSILDDAGS